MNSDHEPMIAAERKPIQFRLLSLFLLVTTAAVGTWLAPAVYRFIPPLDSSAIMPALLIVYPFLILGAIDLIVEWHHRQKAAATDKATNSADEAPRRS